MAAHTLTRKLSRHNMLSGMSAIGLFATTRSSHAVPPAPPAVAGPDAELLQRIAVADQRRDEFNAARLEGLRVRATMARHPDYPPDLMARPIDDSLCAEWAAVAERTGYRAAMDRRNRACGVYNAAAQAVLDTPPRSLHGLYTKLGFAVRAAREGDYGGHDHGDRDWLDIALADAARMAGLERA